MAKRRRDEEIVKGREKRHCWRDGESEWERLARRYMREWTMMSERKRKKERGNG